MIPEVITRCFQTSSSLISKTIIALTMFSTRILGGLHEFGFTRESLLISSDE